MAPKKKQGGGRKEAPLAIVGSNDVAASLGTSPTAEEMEQQSYRELLARFFEKLIRWQEIHEDKKYHRENDKYSDFEVLQTSQGLTLSPLNRDIPLHGKLPPNRVIVMSRVINIDRPEQHIFNREIIVRPGQAGTHLLVDPEGRSLEEVEIELYNSAKINMYNQWEIESNTIRISTEYAQYTNTTEDRYKGVIYDVEKEQIEVHRYLWFPLMSKEYAAHLFNTIDALIPNTSPPIPQTEPRASQEAMPKRLPLFSRLLRRRPAR